MYCYTRIDVDRKNYGQLEHSIEQKIAPVLADCHHNISIKYPKDYDIMVDENISLRYPGVTKGSLETIALLRMASSSPFAMAVSR